MPVQSPSLRQLIRDLKKFEGRKEIVKALRKEIRKPVPGVRKAIRARALSTLPASGGLAAWVAKTRITVKIKLSGRAAGVTLVGGRNSRGGRTDVNAIDRGRLRAPNWGNPARGWHEQTVTDGFFTQPAGEADQWQAACVEAVDNALRKIT